MTPSEVAFARDAIVKEILAAEAKLKDLQKRCPHKNSRDSDGPARGDSYFECRDCGKKGYSNYYRPQHDSDESLEHAKELYGKHNRKGN